MPNVVWNLAVFKYYHIESNSKKISGRIYIRNFGKLYIGENFKANSGKMNNPIGGDTMLKLVVLKGAELIIGNNVGISNSTLYASNKIIIEDDVLIGGGCKIYDTDFHSINYENRIDPFKNNIPDKDIKTSQVIIKKGSWIGGHCIILKGVTIGNNSIIGAGSVVTKNIPKNEIWGGNPAKFIKKIN